MAIAVDPRKSFDYVLREERKLPKGEQSIFKLKPLTATELAQVEDTLNEWLTGGAEPVLRMRSGSQAIKVLDLGLTGWENFKDGEGKSVPFRGPEDYDRLRPEWRRELANAITEGQIS